MFFVITTPFRLLYRALGIVQSILSLLLLAATIYLVTLWHPWATAYVPDGIAGLGEYTATTTQCMVEKSWSDLDPVAIAQIRDTRSLVNIAPDDLAKIYSHATECSH